MKSLLWIFSYTFLLIVMISCNGSGSEKNKNIIHDTGLAQQNKIENDTHISSEYFSVFWLAFRNFVLNNDQNNLNLYICKPLEVYGFEDQDPKILLSNPDSIQAIFKQFLYEQNLDYPEISKHYELFQKTTHPDNLSGYAASDNWRRVEQMEFTLDEKGWRLSRIYMDTKNIKKGNK